MGSQQPHRYNIESGHGATSKRGVNIRVYLPFDKPLEVNLSGCEMQDVKNNEQQEEQAPVQHRTRRCIGRSVLRALIPNWLSTTIESRELYARHRVNDKTYKQHHPHQPQHSRMTKHLSSDCSQESAIVINLIVPGACIYSGEELEVARHMPKHEPHEHQPADCHRNFLSDGRSVKRTKKTHTAPFTKETNLAILPMRVRRLNYCPPGKGTKYRDKNKPRLGVPPPPLWVISEPPPR